MTDFKGIRGWKVQTLSTDPAASVAASGSWASASSVNQARSGVGSAGTQSANLMFGGPAPGGHGAKTELYDGSTWTEVNDLNTPRHSAGSMGTSTAAVYCGGRASPTASTTVSENWNGTSWTEGNDINRSRYGVGNKGAGTQTAGLIAGGNQRFSPVTTPNYFAGTEEYDGTSWTEVNDLPSGLESGGGIGTQTAAGLWGGYSGSYTNAGQLYDGTNWTSTTAMPITGGAYGSSGTTTDGILFGFFIGPSSTSAGNTISWDGTAFTEQNDLSTARYNGAFPKGSGDSSQVAIMAAGYSGTADVANTEEWTTTFTPTTFKKINLGQVYFNSTANAFKVTQTSAADGSWASITSGNTARRVASGVGSSVSNGMVIAGYPQENEVETWNGTSWTEVAEVNTARGDAGASSNSPNSSALFFGGDARPGGASRVANNESWNGSAWTETGDLPAAVNGNAGAGVSNTSALSFGGSLPAKSGATYDWNGSSWTTGGTMATARYYLAGAGTATAALALGGFRSSPANAILTSAESYDGSSWSNLSNTNSGHAFGGASGTTTEALLFGGEGPSYPGGAMTQTEYWDGTSWTEVADISTGNNSPAGFGSSGVSAISSFGNTPSGLLATAEEFAAGTTNKTITVS